jgi:hypothetical protein
LIQISKVFSARINSQPSDFLVVHYTTTQLGFHIEESKFNNL